MKRKLVILIVVGLVLVGLAKLFVVIGSAQVMSGIKENLVRVGALNYQSVSTDLWRGHIYVGQPSFKHFRLKREVKAERAQIEFGSAIGLVGGIIKSLQSDYSSIQALGISNSLLPMPDNALYEQVSETMPIAVDHWFGWLSCDGSQSPTSTMLSSVGIAQLNADVAVQFSQNLSTIQLDVVNLGRFMIELDLLSAMHGENVGIRGFKYVDNGYFRRLQNTCDLGFASQNDMANQIVAGWVERLSAENLRFSEAFAALIQNYIAQGGALAFSIEPSSNVVLNTDDAAAYGWAPIDNLPAVTAVLNNDASAVVALERYTPPPVVIETAPQAPVREPGYEAIEVEEYETLINQRVRIVLLNDKEHEGLVTNVTEHTVEIVPLEGATGVSFTFGKIDIATVDVWVP